MEAKNLMIGDWVYNPFTRKNLRITLGRDIDTEECLCLEPIPITAEILEKNGFKKDSSDNMYKWNWGVLGACASYDKNNTLRLFTFGKLALTFPLHYVHELQHCLRLCDIDKEIQL